MAILYYSTWLLTEQLRLFNELTLEGYRWWCASGRDAGQLLPDALDRGPTPPPQGRVPARDRTPDTYFERLIGVVERIARHAFFPGKQEAVQHCLEEVGDLIAAGRITMDQGAVLVSILSGACPRVA